MMRNMMKTLLLGSMVTIFVTATASAEVIVNGSFEEGYSGWTITEENSVGCPVPTTPVGGCPEWGTWGDGDSTKVLTYLGDEFDNLDQMDITQYSWVLALGDLAIQPTDQSRMIVFLNNGPETHTMFQDITVPDNATVLSWDMFYNQFHMDGYVSEFGLNQYLMVSLVDVQSGIKEPLFTTYSGDPAADSLIPLEIPTTNFSYDITGKGGDSSTDTDYRGKQVLILVEIVTEAEYVVAGFDNFALQVEEVSTTDEPAVLKPAWGKGAKKGWKGGTMPPGLVKKAEKKLKAKKDKLSKKSIDKVEKQMGKGKANAPGQKKKKK